MSHFTEFLPDRVENPIVVEIRHPFTMEEGDPQRMDDGLHGELHRVGTDAEWLDSKSKMANDLGADEIAILLVNQVTHWRAKTGKRGDPDRKKYPRGQDVYITVHLPPTVRLDAERATQALMDWLESSEFGEVLLQWVRSSRMISHISARGERYSGKEELGFLVKEDLIEDISAATPHH